MSYQTILLVIQGFPRRCKTVNRFSTIIGAPFKGRACCLGLIVDAFKNFWGSAYVDVKEPEGGWPTSIKAALQASCSGDETSSIGLDHETLDALEINPHNDSNLSPVLEGSGAISSRGEVRLDETTSITLAEHSIQSSLRDETAICKPPSTPRKQRHAPNSTPPRRQRTSSSSRTLHASNLEPCSPLTDRRKKNAPLASSYTSPTPKVSDKENVSPKPLPDVFASVLGKRKMEPVAEDSTGYVKRKISSSRSLKAARMSGEGTVMVNGSPAEVGGDGVGSTPSKKRKSEVFAGVEVPTVKEVMLRRRHSAPLKEVADSQSSDLLSPNIRATALRKSRSTTRMNVMDHDNADDFEASPRKKIRTIRSGEPIALIVDFPVAGSGKSARLHLRNEVETDNINSWRIDDSIMTVDPSTTTAQPSSDDDPIKLGRYTPRVLVSPVLSVRRLNEKRWDEGDVGSDDSVEPNSPTKDVIERRKKMGWPTKRAAEGERGILLS